MNQEFNILVGARIRQTRELLSLSREKFSEQCGISSSFLADIERGKKGLSAETLYKICTGANISPNYIISGTDASNGVSAIVELLSQLESKHIDSAVGILREFINAINQK
ncbi:MAG: helix-turn-helix domain-containing protein [Clostridiales bacterium]|nr:helix-turn-helix domain-containing protein [Clostridiales bacterium]